MFCTFFSMTLIPTSTIWWNFLFEFFINTYFPIIFLLLNVNQNVIFCFSMIPKNWIHRIHQPNGLNSSHAHWYPSLEMGFPVKFALMISIFPNIIWLSIKFGKKTSSYFIFFIYSFLVLVYYHCCLLKRLNFINEISP